MVHIAIPSITPRLACSAVDALRRTIDVPYRVRVTTGGSHGDNLDRAMHDLPDSAEWLFTMDDDAAPMRRGWLSWLLGWIGQEDRWASFWRTGRGLPHPLGTLYRVSWLREVKASFVPCRRPEGFFDVGEAFGTPELGRVAPRYGGPRPWWLRNVDAAADEGGHLTWAHLGGGTIGSTSWRCPSLLWPVLVRRHLRRA